MVESAHAPARQESIKRAFIASREAVLCKKIRRLGLSLESCLNEMPVGLCSSGRVTNELAHTRCAWGPWSGTPHPCKALDDESRRKRLGLRTRETARASAEERKRLVGRWTFSRCQHQTLASLRSMLAELRLQQGT